MFTEAKKLTIFVKYEMQYIWYFHHTNFTEVCFLVCTWQAFNQSENMAVMNNLM